MSNATSDYFGLRQKLHMDFLHGSSMVSPMDDRHDLIGALLSEAAGLLEDAASLAPLGDRAKLLERITLIEEDVRNALALIAAVRVMVKTALHGR